jgi:DNA-binding transcriptional LysR family regulator
VIEADDAQRNQRPGSAPIASSVFEEVRQAHDRTATPSDLVAMRYAVLTTETFSFARAAAVAGVKQATLSKTIAGLEGRIGFKLFDRSTRGAIPTPVGVQWLDEGRRILADLNRLHSNGLSIGSGRSGTLSLGFSMSLAGGHMRALIRDFVGYLPELRLVGVEGDRCRLFQALQGRTVDFAVICGSLPDLGLKRRPMWSERVLVILPEAHRLVDKDRIYWPDLRNERFIFPQQDPGADLAELARARLGEPGWPADIEIHEVTRDNVANMVPIGRYVSLTTDSALGRTLPGIVLREVFDSGAGGVAHVDYTGYWRSDNHSPVLSRFLELVGDRYPA